MIKKLSILIVLVCITLGVACEKQVISEKSYSPSQFSEYSHLPRKKVSHEPQTDYLQDLGRGMNKLFKNMGNGLKKLNPFD